MRFFEFIKKKYKRKEPDIVDLLDQTTTALQQYLKQLDEDQIHDISNCNQDSIMVTHAKDMFLEEKINVSLAIYPLIKARDSIKLSRIVEDTVKSKEDMIK